MSLGVDLEPSLVLPRPDGGGSRGGGGLVGEREAVERGEELDAVGAAGLGAVTECGLAGDERGDAGGEGGGEGGGGVGEEGVGVGVGEELGGAALQLASASSSIA